MKDAIVVLVVILLSLIFCERTASILPPFYPPINIESILETQDQAEASYAEIEFTYINDTLFHLFLNENRTLTITLSPSILPGMVSILWNPPK